MRRVTVALCGALSIFALTTSAHASEATPLSPERAVVSANCSPGVQPQDCNAAAFVYNYALSHNFNGPPNHKAHPYGNTDGQLPAGGDYITYDIYVTTPRSDQRIVIDKNNPSGNSWYTHDHYEPGSFYQFFLVA
ncbi:ribonuclease domain-containing protein [Amycolatopsis antarctica]